MYIYFYIYCRVKLLYVRDEKRFHTFSHILCPMSRRRRRICNLYILVGGRLNCKTVRIFQIAAVAARAALDLSAVGCKQKQDTKLLFTDANRNIFTQNVLIFLYYFQCMKKLTKTTKNVNGKSKLKSRWALVYQTSTRLSVIEHDKLAQIRTTVFVFLIIFYFIFFFHFPQFQFFAKLMKYTYVQIAYCISHDGYS